MLSGTRSFHTAFPRNFSLAATGETAGQPLSDWLALISSGFGIANKTAFEADAIPASIKLARVHGYTEEGDGGGQWRVRVDSQPTYGGWRSADRFLSDGTVSASNGGWWQIAEDVINVRHFGAKGDAVQDPGTGAWSGTDDTAAFQLTENVGNLLGKRRFFPRGNYFITASIMNLEGVAARNDIDWSGEGEASQIIQGGSFSAFRIIGGFSGAVGGGAYLTAGVTVGTDTHTVNSTAALEVDQWYALVDNTQTVNKLDSTATAYCLEGEVNRIREIVDATTFKSYGMAENTYGFDATAADSSIIYTWGDNAHKRVRFSNFRVVWDETLAYTMSNSFFRLQTIEDVRITGVTFINVVARCISLTGIAGFTIENCNFWRASAGTVFEPGVLVGTPYTILFDEATSRGLVKNCRMSGGRHLVTTAGDTGGIEPSHIDIVSCQVSGSPLSAFDTHEWGRDIRFIDCIAVGVGDDETLVDAVPTKTTGSGDGSGFQIKSRRTTIINPSVSGYSQGVLFYENRNNRVIGGDLHACRHGVKVTTSENIEIKDVLIRDPIERGIWIEDMQHGSDPAIGGLKIRGVRIMGDPSVAAVDADVTYGTDCVFEFEAPDATVKSIGVPESHKLALSRGIAKNFVINPSFDVWQEATTFTPPDTTNPRHCADGWQCRGLTTGREYSRQTGFTGAQYCLRARKSTGNENSSTTRVGQKLSTEVSKQLAGQTVVLSFDARAGAGWSGTVMSVSIASGTGTDETLVMSGTTFATGNVTNSETVATDTTLTTTAQRFYSTPYTIPSNATEVGVSMNFQHDAIAAPADDYVEVTNVKLEIGTFSTPFEPEPLAVTMDACLRRYRKSFKPATAPVQNAGAGTGEFTAPALVAGANTEVLGRVQFGAPMRGVPTVTLYNPAAANAQVRDLTAAADCSSSTVSNATEDGFDVACTGNASTTVGGKLGFHWVADART